MKKLLLLLCVCFSCTLIATAQTQDKKWNIGLHGGATQFNGDYSNDFYRTKMPFYAFGGLSVSRYLGSHFDINLLATKGRVGFNNPDGRYSTDISTASLNLRFNILGPNTPVRPYVFVGGGVMLFDKNLSVSSSRTDFIAPSFGGGINFRMGPSVMLNIQETFFYSSEDKRDGVVSGSNDAYLLHTVGLTFNFGKKKDADKDGVADRNDQCANTPAGVLVDKRGCPLDRDLDGIADYMDTCPDIAGVAGLSGCPDTDGDGITDADDRCPQVAGLSKFRGCPDSDADGVPDVDDRCQGTAAGYKVDERGCVLDNDKDGIVNEEDACPDKFGIAALKGCPDSDGDGVADNEDRCPTVKGPLTNKGCPVITQEDVKKITQIANKIFFETNSDKLRTSSLEQLDQLVVILNRYETAGLVIDGYTDSKGTDEYNMVLSQKRTESVKLYLTSKDIAAYRLTATGYGEAKPIADNNTVAGRSRNRRVELSTSY
jgi:OmpA-OmpF porin, OOP family